ncbi:uncharacterized protein UDID_19556 [Ustilago sp. UG-2017a]|nr:uncharacterized protein UDID_19556 [Ustilago sp. UG-2017a]
MSMPPNSIPTPDLGVPTTHVLILIVPSYLWTGSWHVDLGLSTSAFSSDHLARAIRGFKRSAGNSAPTAKLPITLPLLRRLVDSLPSVCHSRHNWHMFCTAFCLAFACLLRSGKFTWETPSSPPLLTVGSVEFAEDGSYATVFLPSSKTDPFRTGVTLTAPVVPLMICLWRPSEGYSGHSFQRGAATSAAANGTDSNMIQGLGRWCSDCFGHYVNMSAADHAATSARALYSNANQPLDLSQPVWHDF